MQAGALRHRVLLQERSTAEDTFGQQKTTWTDYDTIWASVKPLSGRELLAAQAVNTEVTHKVVTRYQPGIKPSMRAIHADRIFEIQSVLDIEERHISLDLLCTEGLTEG
jgi:SPP1 family predicted phage head-tail adaptor